jgi:hypothetical protein
MADKTYPIELSLWQIDVLQDVIEHIGDKMRHYEDAELGWDEGDIEAWSHFVAQHRETARAARFWWAQR